MCSGIKVTCSFMMNCHVIIRIHVCNWFTHLQPEWQTICHIDHPIFTVYCQSQNHTHSFGSLPKFHLSETLHCLSAALHQQLSCSDKGTRQAHLILTSTELQLAEEYWISVSQEDLFAEEIETLKKGRVIANSSCFLSLHPFPMGTFCL